MQTMTITLEALMALLVTFLIALVVMGSFGGLSALGSLLALVQGAAAFFLWERWAAPR